jgi:hypothetical protein
MPSYRMITRVPTHFDRGNMGWRCAIAVGEKAPSPVNLPNRNLACPIREEGTHRHFGLDQYVGPIDWARHFCPNTYWTRENRFPVLRKFTTCAWQQANCFCPRGQGVVWPRLKRQTTLGRHELGEVEVILLDGAHTGGAFASDCWEGTGRGFD